MEIGDVLLRDAQYVWRTRKALIVKDAVVLQLPKEPQPRETFALDGRFTCEAVVVSSAHLHSVRLCDIHTGAEYLVDTRSRGKKQVWVEIFKNVRRLDAFQPILPTRRAAMHTLSSAPLSDHLDAVDVKKLQELVRKSPKLQAAAGKLLRGSDVGSLLQNDYGALDDAVGDQLLHIGLLEACCCSCGHFNQGNSLYLVNRDVMQKLISTNDFVDANKSDRRHRHRYHKSEPCLLTPVFTRVLGKFEHAETLNGLEIVQRCLHNGIFNVPTAITVADEMVQRNLIQRSDQSEESDTFSMDADSKYVQVATSDIVPADNQTNVEPPSEDFTRFYEEYKVLKERYDLLFYVLCGFCIVVVLDGCGVALPRSLKLAAITGLLVWLTLGDGSATLHINIRKSGALGQGSTITAAFMSSPGTTSMPGFGAAPPGGQPNIMPGNAPSFASSEVQLVKKDTSSSKIVEHERSFDGPQALPSSDQVLVHGAEAKAKEARVHSFRLAIAQAASIPYESTQVYTDDYLYSVMTVKDRAFGYAVTKIAKCLEWRVQYGVDSIALEDVNAQLASGSMYWYGYDFENRPILWVRARLKDWENMSRNRETEIKAHIYLLDKASRELMPPGVTTYTVVTDSAKMGPSHLDLRLMHGLLDACVANFPDRIGMVHAGPMTQFLAWVVPMLWPFLPVRLRHKVSFMRDCVKDLSKYMKTELIPKHMGGTADHILRPTPSSDPKKALDVSYMFEQQKLRMKEISMK
ncbi:Transmembrane protein, partial [Globisporangium splendens]